MKILLITTSYPENNEGAAAAGVFVADFARSLLNLGHSPAVIAPGVDSTARIENGIRVFRFSAPRLPLSLLRPLRPRDWPAIVRTLHSGQKTVSMVCENECFDHILALWALPSGDWALHQSRRSNTPYSVWALGSDIWSLKNLPVVRQRLNQVLRSAHHVFADGHQLCMDTEYLSGRSCHFLPSARRLGPLTPKALKTQAPYRFAYLGRWHPNKGIDVLLHSLEQLREDDWRHIEAIRIAGGGPLSPLVQTISSRLQHQGRPVFVEGFLNQKQATDLLLWADYLIIPSRVESIPVVFSDAMQTNCPVIATPVGDFPQIFSDYPPGILCESPNPHAMASAIRHALRRTPHEFMSALQYWAGKFDIESNAEYFSQILTSKFRQ